MKRFEENSTFLNVMQPTRDEVLCGFIYQGQWFSYFKNSNPIILELGCGKGEYTIGLARAHPDVNYIGIDIKGARFWRGAKTALEEGLKNVCFLRVQIELVDFIFSEGEVSEIWIPFPDPQMKRKRAKHRLTGLKFLEKYDKILNQEGLIHLKTDNAFIYGYTLGLLDGKNHEILYAHHDLYRNTQTPSDAVKIQTYYESKYLEEGKSIAYLKFSIKS